MLTVRDLARRKDPDFDRHVHQQIAAVGPRIQQSVAAINRRRIDRELHSGLLVAAC